MKIEKRGKDNEKTTFEYKDAYSYGKWSTQTCCVGSIQECINLYGLNQPDVEYRIVEVKEI